MWKTLALVLVCIGGIVAFIIIPSINEVNDSKSAEEKMYKIVGEHFSINEKNIWLTEVGSESSSNHYYIASLPDKKEYKVKFNEDYTAIKRIVEK
ncbi:hypothetical protein [Anaerobacillus sp. 1_MG-2023]|uniref:hypothetical protein n=1 Tax=Anaerobacillus sp. 1_MG-2023 TaxID=3062655 RepID=UPI0026E298D5|nr:hypothetical protein [Anaerobacillus sp. 1_MG-2023]MDO6657473.1 hypothetical protein [Anaerobacillus sp. 1_MG-2023]